MSVRGLDVVFQNADWRIARCTRASTVLRYDPRLADLGCLDQLREARFFAQKRWLWIIECHGAVVATMRCSDDEDDEIFWKEPELIGIASSPTAWKILPSWVQTQSWQRLLDFIRGHSAVVHDRPEIRRLAESTFRARVDRAINEANRKLLQELVEDCPFWGMNRDELVKEESYELRQWHRLLRLPTGTSPEIESFTRSLRHAAGLIQATKDAEPE
jgi:hypothetical protein